MASSLIHNKYAILTVEFLLDDPMCNWDFSLYNWHQAQISLVPRPLMGLLHTSCT